MNGTSYNVEIENELHEDDSVSMNVTVDGRSLKLSSSYKPGNLLIPVHVGGEREVLQFVEKASHTYSLIHRGTQVHSICNPSHS